MRKLYLGAPLTSDTKNVAQWTETALHEIERASIEDVDLAAIAKDFTVSNYTVTRTLNGGTATATDVANVLCTLIDDIKRRGSKGRD